MLGKIAMLVYVLSTALSLVVINSVETHIHPSIVAFYSFLICVLFFNLLNFNRNKYVYTAFLRCKVDFLILNGLTAVIWLGTFWGLEYVAPTIFVVLFMGVIPYSTMLISRDKKVFFNFRTVSLLFGIAVTLAFIIYENIHLVTLSVNTYIGLFLAVVSGFFSAVYIVYSAHLQKKLALETKDFLCARFYMLILLCFFIAIYRGYDFQFDVLYSNWYDFISVSIFTVIIPLYSLQKAILTIGPVKVSCLIPFTPIVTYVLQIFLGVQFNATVFILLFIATLLLSFYYLRSR